MTRPSHPQRLPAPRRGAVPEGWVLAARAAATVVFGCVATAQWVPFDSLTTAVPGTLGQALAYGPISMLVALVSWVATGAVAAGVVLLAVRRPVLALGLAVLPLLVVVLLGARVVPFAIIAVLAGVTVAAAWRSPPVSVLATTAALATVALWYVVQVPMLAPLGSVVELQYTDTLVVGVLYVVALGGLLVGTLAARGHAVTAQEEEHRRATRSVEVEEQSQVTAERARLARDLHDVVAHHVSLIAVRAETAPYTHPSLPAEARAVLAEIASDARRALDELRGVLGILGRSAGGDRTPQPSWNDVAALVDRGASSGERVTLVGVPVARLEADTDSALGYVAYRVVQEGLTNARRHAPGAATTVRLERTGALAVVSVVTAAAAGAAWRTDDEPTAPITAVAPAPRAVPPGTPAPREAGQGLAGMRERVEALGGRLVAGPRDGGFALEATLPLGSDGRP